MSTHLGKIAEKLVASHLVSQGHSIEALNWRTKMCEIDVVSKYRKNVYFTEVKFRSQNNWGSGYEYVMPKKIAQMKFSARYWMHLNGWKYDAVLQVASVSRDESIEWIILDGSETS